MPNFFIAVTLLEKTQTHSSVTIFTPYWLYNHKTNVLHSMSPLNLLRKAQFSMVWGLLFYDGVNFSTSL